MMEVGGGGCGGGGGGGGGGSCLEVISIETIQIIFSIIVIDGDDVRVGEHVSDDSSIFIHHQRTVVVENRSEGFH